MKKEQILLIGCSLVILLGLFFAGATVNPAKKKNTPTPSTAVAAFSMDGFKQAIIAQLPETSKKYLESVEKGVPASEKDPAYHTYLHKLSEFWRDTAGVTPLHYFYESKLAELDNTEKSLTFAAHSILGYLPFEQNHDVQHWMAGTGKELFEKALMINPGNDSSVVGLGGCLMYGAPAANGGNAMAGIMKVREVAERDSTNIFAQYMLGVGGVISKQYDKAAARFEKVVKIQPENLQVMFRLAEAYELGGNNEKAIEWYSEISRRINNADLKAEIESRITTLKGS